MRIEIDRDLLAAAARHCAQALPRKATDPSQLLILMEAEPENGRIRLTANGPLFQIAVNLPAETDTDDTRISAIALPGLPFRELTDGMPPGGPVTMKLDKPKPGRPRDDRHRHRLNITRDPLAARLLVATPESFHPRPQSPEPDPLHSATVAGKEFAKAVRRVLHTTARQDREGNDDEPPAASGVNISIPEPGHNLHLVTTDGFRLSSHVVPLTGSTAASWQATIPAPAIRLVAQLAEAAAQPLTATVTEQPNQTAFRTGNAEIIASKVAMPFPDVNQAVSDTFSWACAMGPSQLQRLLAPAKAFSHADTARVKITHLPADPDGNPDRLQIDMAEPDLGQLRNHAPLDAFNGQPGQNVHLQYRYLHDAATVGWDGSVTLHVPSDSPAVMFQNPDDNAYFMLVARMADD